MRQQSIVLKAKGLSLELKRREIRRRVLAGRKNVDVREPDEFAQGHIEGAVNIPLGKLIRDLGQGIVPTDKPVVVHCKSGGRGAIALDVLKKKGFTNVQNLEGGFSAWTCSL